MLSKTVTAVRFLQVPLGMWSLELILETWYFDWFQKSFCVPFSVSYFCRKPGLLLLYV